MYRILLTGTYNSRNKGDAAMELSTAEALKSALKDSEITISTPFPYIDRDFYHPIKIIGCSRRRLIWASFQLLRAYLWGMLFKHLKLTVNALIPERELLEYTESDFIVDLSGDMLTEDYGPHVAYSHFIPILTALFLHKKVFLCAQSIGRFKITAFLARYIFKRVEMITVRDGISLRYLESMGISSESLSMTADMAFLLEPVNGKEIKSIFQRENIPCNKSGFLGVSLSQLVESKYEKNNPHSKETDFRDMFAASLDTICSELDLEVLFVSHVTGPASKKDDRIISRDIQRRMKQKAYVLEDDYRPEELKGMIGHCTIFLGARMHANIAALSSGIPVTAISYSHKTSGIMEMFGQKNMVCPIESLSPHEMYEKVKFMYTNKDDISSVLNERIGGIRKKAMLNIELLVKKLRE